jgi:hypothetical protein
VILYAGPMRSRTLAPACALAAIALGACGQTAKPLAGSRSLNRQKPAGRGVVDDPRTKHLKCLRQQGLTVATRGTSDLLIGTGSEQVLASFAPTPGAAQEEQISGHVQGAEVIDSALVYPRHASDQALKKIEDCLAQGVLG